MTDTDTCTRCGELPAAPGKFGQRCSACIEAVYRASAWGEREE